MTDDGLCYDGEIIALEPENAPQLAAAVEALRRDSQPGAPAADAAEQSFAKTVRAMQSAIAEFHRLQAMDLDAERRYLVTSAIESWRSGWTASGVLRRNTGRECRGGVTSSRLTG